MPQSTTSEGRAPGAADASPTRFLSRAAPRPDRFTVLVLGLVLGLVSGAAGAGAWLAFQRAGNRPVAGRPNDDNHEHSDHDHGHEPAGENGVESLKLTAAGRKNIGLQTVVVQPATFVKTVSLPAIVVERPGRSQVSVTAPMTGIVTRVQPIEGESVEPDSPLFELRLTHEDLVTAQRDFLRSAQQLDVVEREIARLQSVGEGVIAGRRIVEQRYEREKIEAAVLAQRQGLLLHGLSESQIDQISDSRRLVRELTIRTPAFPDAEPHDDAEHHLFHVQRIDVKPGEHVTAGQTLAVLADHCLLYVEGQALETDAQRLLQAAREGWELTVVDHASGGGALQLSVLYVADQIDRESRALPFYLSLPNELAYHGTGSTNRFVAWKYRPGQRMEVKLPVEDPWVEQLVLPPAAVVVEGADAFVFEQNGDYFERVAVHVLYRDKDAVVVENDGTLVGSSLVVSGAYLLHLQLKNQGAGPVDPHAGHSH